MLLQVFYEGNGIGEDLYSSASTHNKTYFFQYQDGELTLLEHVESRDDIKKCIDEEKTSVDECEISLVVKKCMEENGFN